MTNRRVGMIAAITTVVVLAVAAAATLVGLALSRPHGTVAAARPTTGWTCPPLHTGTPPAWAQGGFTGRDFPPFAISSSGDVVAFVFGDPLSAPPAADHNNKILWVGRSYQAHSDIAVTAWLQGSDDVSTLSIPAGPSIVTMPAAGCWHLDLRVGTRHDSLNLRWIQP